MPVPAHPKIYHITHLKNLPQIVGAEKLWSDAKRLEKSLDCELVGMSKIKRRRLEGIVVDCHSPTKVGEYVPFYFCPRSIMLYILHRGNHPDVTYRGGQAPLVHLQADLHTVVEWAEEQSRRWAFSNRNAGGFTADFFASLERLDEVDWQAVAATDFRSSDVREGKQAEFLVHRSFPWSLIEQVGVIDLKTKQKVDAIIKDASHKPPVHIRDGWYF